MEEVCSQGTEWRGAEKTRREADTLEGKWTVGDIILSECWFL